MGVGGNQGVEADPKPLGDEEHGITGNYGVPALETGRTTGGNPAGGRHSHPRHAEHIAGEDLVGIGNMGIGGDQGVETDPKPLGDEKHGVAGNYGTGLETGGQLAGTLSPRNPMGEGHHSATATALNPFIHKYSTLPYCRPSYEREAKSNRQM